MWSSVWSTGLLAKIAEVSSDGGVDQLEYFQLVTQLSQARSPEGLTVDHARTSKWGALHPRFAWPGVSMGMDPLHCVTCKTVRIDQLCSRDVVASD